MLGHLGFICSTVNWMSPVLTSRACWVPGPNSWHRSQNPSSTPSTNPNCTSISPHDWGLRMGHLPIISTAF